MKNTPIGLMPEGWSARPLGDLCEIHGRIGFRGYTKADLVRRGEGAITFSPSDIDNQRISYKDCDYISWAKYTESPEIQVKEGDILFCKTASIGKCAQIWDLKEKATINPQFVLLDDFKCNSSLLYYMLAFSSFQTRVLVITGGSTIPTISQEAMKKLLIPIPDNPEEQKRIAETLLSIDRIIGALDEAIGKKRQIKEGLMQQLLTGKTRLPGFSGEWKSYKLKELAEMNSGGTPSSKEPLYYGGEIHFLSISDMTSSGKFVYSTEKTITQMGLENSSARIFQTGTLMYAMYASLGKCSISQITTAISQAILGFVLSDKIDKMFLYYHLCFIEEQVKNMGQTGTQSNLSKTLVEQFVIRTPNIAEQIAIAEVLTTIDDVILDIETKRDKYVSIKQGMMQELLTGKTRLK